MGNAIHERRLEYGVRQSISALTSYCTKIACGDYTLKLEPVEIRGILQEERPSLAEQWFWERLRLALDGSEGRRNGGRVLCLHNMGEKRRPRTSPVGGFLETVLERR